MSGLEVAGIVLGATSLFISAFENLESDKQGRSSWTPVRPQTPNDCYLRVYDLSYGGGVSQRLGGASKTHTTLKDDLDSLPLQEATFRNYILETFSMDDTNLLAHLYPEAFRQTQGHWIVQKIHSKRWQANGGGRTQ
jgi:hypothetical protein